MTTLALTIEKQARKLSPTERERLAERLMASMTGERLTSVDEAWVAEAEQRFSAWKRKRTKPLSASKSLRDIRKDLRR
jgi:putative addiction module component (TIGR02574 family)